MNGIFESAQFGLTDTSTLYRYRYTFSRCLEPKCDLTITICDNNDSTGAAANDALQRHLRDIVTVAGAIRLSCRQATPKLHISRPKKNTSRRTLVLVSLAGEGKQHGTHSVSACSINRARETTPASLDSSIQTTRLSRTTSACSINSTRNRLQPRPTRPFKPRVSPAQQAPAVSTARETTPASLDSSIQTTRLSRTTSTFVVCNVISINSDDKQRQTAPKLAPSADIRRLQTDVAPLARSHGVSRIRQRAHTTTHS